ncbi:SPOR domain-containing protein [Kineosporia rhizophila]|uniref:SPOR domain-containing protein n=1 Tax=Kineosporia TaxID=49184 RepID=UPI000A4DF2DF|nr:SPOR domain-containing protein [Kineosporia sp. NBRC 101677]MCE0535566.1 SPOR domain-containing protein [Kineosporia rhizophila]
MTDVSSASRQEAEQTQTPATGVSRWSVQAPGIDVFWPILAAVLTAIVIIVAAIAHSSMTAVGVGTPRTDWAPLPAAATDEPFVVVQVASFPTRDEAHGEARELRQTGLDAGVLKSDRYAPMNAGWFVVYVGPFEDDAEGRAQAQAITEEIDGSIVRTLQRR